MTGPRAAAGRPARDGGVVAVEFALSFVLLFAILSLIAPLGTALLTKVRLERAAGDAARFATQSPDRPRPGVAGYRPTVAEVQTEATDDFQTLGGSTASGWATPVVSADPTSTLAGAPITVTLTATALGRQE